MPAKICAVASVVEHGNEPTSQTTKNVGHYTALVMPIMLW